MSIWGRLFSTENQERKKMIRRYEACGPRIEELHLQFLSDALNQLKIIHGNVSPLITKDSATFLVYAPETKTFVSGRTAREILRFPDIIDVHSPETTFEDIKRATFHSENRTQSLINGLGREQTDRYHPELKKRGYEYSEYPLSWVNSIYVTRNGERIAHAAPGDDNSLLQLPGRVYEHIRNGYPGRGEMSNMVVEVGYAVEKSQSLGERARLLLVYEDFSAVRSSANDRYVEKLSNAILPFLRALSTAMRDCKYEDYILEACALWMKNPDPEPRNFDDPMYDDMPFK